MLQCPTCLYTHHLVRVSQQLRTREGVGTKSLGGREEPKIQTRAKKAQASTCPPVPHDLCWLSGGRKDSVLGRHKGWKLFQSNSRYSVLCPPFTSECITNTVPQGSTVKRKLTEGWWPWVGDATAGKRSRHTPFSAGHSWSWPLVPALTVTPCAPKLHPAIFLWCNFFTCETLSNAAPYSAGLSVRVREIDVQNHLTTTEHKHRVVLLLSQIHHDPKLICCSSLLGLHPFARCPTIAIGALNQPQWTDLLVQGQSQQRKTHLVGSGAGIFLFFQLLQERNHLSKQHNNHQSCYFHLQNKPKWGLRKTEGGEIIFRIMKWPLCGLVSQGRGGPFCSSLTPGDHGRTQKNPGIWLLSPITCVSTCSLGSGHSFSSLPLPLAESPRLCPVTPGLKEYPPGTSIPEVLRKHVEPQEQLWTPSGSQAGLRFSHKA